MTLADLTFENRYTASLPADPLDDVRPRQVHNACFSRVEPTPTDRPALVAYSHEVATQLGLSREEMETDRFAEVFSGNGLLDGMDPFAACYGGHQFGNWAGQLGDGRAIALGEVIAADGSYQMLQLKGAGPTPYSRSGDGRAVLRSSIREFLCSEAMYHLGVPTTRALSVVSTGDRVLRDMFYDGHAVHEPGAVVCRVSPSFTRFGNFEIFAVRGELDVLRALMDHTIRTEAPHLGQGSPATYVEWFADVVERTATLMVHWMRVGFVHGVMNTDNLSTLGLTIDYGPYGWLEDFDPSWTPNTTDAHGRRYRFGNQPMVAHWNLVQLANAIHPLVGEAEGLQAEIDRYGVLFEAGFAEMMAKKLGLGEFDASGDMDLIDDVQTVLQLAETDMTVFYRRLGDLSLDSGLPNDDRAAIEPLLDAYYRTDALTDEVVGPTAAWLRQYEQRVARDGMSDGARRVAMHAVNPEYVLRNYLAQLAIDEATAGDFSLVDTLLEVLRRPYDEQSGRERFAKKRPDWARDRPGCSMLSCSS